MCVLGPKRIAYKSVCVSIEVRERESVCVVCVKKREKIYMCICERKKKIKEYWIGERREGQKYERLVKKRKTVCV